MTLTARLPSRTSTDPHPLERGGEDRSGGALAASPPALHDEPVLGPDTQIGPRSATHPRVEPSRRPIVLLIEDDPGDQELIRRALSATGIPIELRILPDGEAALDYLFRRGQYALPGRSPRPHLVLLDLNLPRLDGRAVLESMAEVADLQKIPVIVLTTSDQRDDITWTYKLGAKSYVVKPAQVERFFQIVSEVENYWLRTVSLPGLEG